MFDRDHLVAFAEDRGWTVEGEQITFPSAQEDDKEDDSSRIPATKVIARALLYSRELERIV